jgi:hypothetical protein
MKVPGMESATSWFEVKHGNLDIIIIKILPITFFISTMGKRSRTCFPKLFLSPLTDYCRMFIPEKKMNSAFFHNIATEIFHPYLVVNHCKSS